MDTPEQQRTPAARVQKAAGHYLITHGTWQISVAPDGLLMLPRHLHPEEVDDFVRCALIAKDVGAGVIADNESTSAEPGMPTGRAIVMQGPPPPGATRMRVVSAQQRAASLGREKSAAGERPTPTRTTQNLSSGAQ